jgi:hypothetical protein
MYSDLKRSGKETSFVLFVGTIPAFIWKIQGKKINIFVS